MCRPATGALAKQAGTKSAGAMPMPNSSSSSRASAASGSSPASTLPPGNSQRPAIARPGARCCSRIRPSPSSKAAATTVIVGFFSKVARSRKGFINSGIPYLRSARAGEEKNAQIFIDLCAKAKRRRPSNMA